MDKPNFTENLRYLCAKHGSISQVCRDIGINRQQFNKYLSGASRPSKRNLLRICEYFQVSEARLLIHHQEFISLYGLDRDFKFEQHFNDMFPLDKDDLNRYLGYYYSYFYSLDYPGKLICALVCLYKFKGRVFIKNIEHLYYKKGLPQKDKFINKYAGIVAYSCNRIFIMERDALGSNGFNMTILYPTYQSHISYLHGISTGCAFLGRVPSCVRIVYEHLGRTIDKKSTLSRCGLYDKHEIELPKIVFDLIDNSKDPADFTFRAFNPEVPFQ